MPKYYCDYCDAFLTHDSLKGRKAHNDGRKHKDRVRAYYQKWLEACAQQIVDETVKSFSAGRMHGAVPRTTMMGGPPMPPGMPMMHPGMSQGMPIRPLMMQGQYPPPPSYPPMGVVGGSGGPMMNPRAPQKFHPYK
uniref:U1 small nuclear ribonucleoprotein C n=1 Tax=Caenorhabditis tropicalis TaxID=1561998 RepID=A0A1I7SXT8_9PELO